MTASTIETQHLQLIATTPDLVRAEINDTAEFSSRLGARVPASWPPEFTNEETQTFTLHQLQDQPEQVGWWSWYFVRKNIPEGEQVLIGIGGFKGRPDGNGSVEIGYSVLNEFQRQGYASEAVAGLVDWALAQGVHSITAETLPELLASIQVLEKNGFAHVGKGSEEGITLYHKGRP